MRHALDRIRQDSHTRSRTSEHDFTITTLRTVTLQQFEWIVTDNLLLVLGRQPLAFNITSQTHFTPYNHRKPQLPGTKSLLR